MDQLPCRRCQSPTPTWPILGRLITPICERCATDEYRQSSMGLLAERERERRQRLWEAICPPAYRSTMFERLPCPAQSQRALRWAYGPRGLVLWGVTRRGKSRTAYLLLHKHFHAGKSVSAYDCIRFAEECERHKYGSKAADWTRAMANVDLLLFDDLDKDRLAPHQEGKLFGIFDRRCANEKPTIFTLNARNGWSRALLHGEQFVARMKEFCGSIKFL